MSNLRYFAFLLAIALPSSARARGPLYGSFGLGPFIEANRSETLFSIKPEVGYYVMPNLAVEGPLHIAIGDFTYFGIVPGVHYDLQFPQEPRLMIAPSFGMGFGVLSGFGATEAGFAMRFGTTVKYYVLDDLALAMKFFGLHFLIGAVDGATPVNYDMLFSAIYHIPL